MTNLDKRMARIAFLSGIAAIAGAWLCTAAEAAEPRSSQLYETAKFSHTGGPGTILHQEPVSGAPVGADAYRVLYRSTGLRGEPIAVSGLVIIPQGPAPVGGRHVIAWAHPTTGIVPHCAPSLALFKFQQIQGLREMVARGYVVAATDYPGLGTDQPHPYLVGESEAHAVIDSVRAARNVAQGGVVHQFAVWGHSQGGQAALYTGIMARQYAPELELVGVAAAAPATDLGTLLKDDLATPGGKNLLAMTLWSWQRVFNAPMREVVDPAAIPTVNRLAETCLESLVDIRPRARAGAELQERFLKVNNLTELEPWRGLLAQNSVGVLPRSVPVFIAQGAKDDTVRPAVTRAYVRRLCGAGSRVQFLNLPNAGHGLAAHNSAGQAIQWMSDRFERRPAPSNCGAAG